jgi:hypothetical protein
VAVINQNKQTNSNTRIRTCKNRTLTFFSIILILVLTVIFPNPAASQNSNFNPYVQQVPDTDLPEMQTMQNPTRAAMLSAVLPGMGQAYNRAYWKIPVIYVGFGVVIYAINFNNVAKMDGNPNTIDMYPHIPANNIARVMNFYRRNLEISYISGAALYLLNILDASVQAHLMDFDVGDDLSMRIEPSYISLPSTGNSPGTLPGIKLTFRF